MTTGRSAPAEIVNPQSHLNGTSAFDAADAEAPGLAALGTLGAQAANAAAAVAFRKVRRASFVVMDLSPSRPSRNARRGLSGRDCARATRGGSRGDGRPATRLSRRQNVSVRFRYSSMRTV